MATTTTPTQGNVTSNATLAPCYLPYVMPGETKAMTIYLPVLLAIILVTSLVGNTLVIRGVLITRPKPPSYYLIANLATAELISTFLVPFYFHYHSSPFEWVFGEFMCKFLDTLQVFCYLVVSFMLASLSVYFFTVLMSQKRKRPSRRTSCILVALSWAWGIALSVPTSVGKKFVGFDIPKCGGGKLYHCFISYPSVKMADTMNILLLICQLIIPFFIMVLSYGIVVVKVKQHIKVIREDVAEMSTVQSQTDDTTLNGNDYTRHSIVSSTENQENGERSRTVKMERKLLKMIYLMIFIYFVCYTPDHIVYIANKLKLSWYNNWKYHLIFRKHIRLLHALPAALHPFLYGFLSRIIQRNFKCC